MPTKLAPLWTTALIVERPRRWQTKVAKTNNKKEVKEKRIISDD